MVEGLENRTSSLYVLSESLHGSWTKANEAKTAQLIFIANIHGGAVTYLSPEIRTDLNRLVGSDQAAAAEARRSFLCVIRGEHNASGLAGLPWRGKIRRFCFWAARSR